MPRCSRSHYLINFFNENDILTQHKRFFSPDELVAHLEDLNTIDAYNVIVYRELSVAEFADLPWDSP